MNERFEKHPTEDEWDSPAWNSFYYGPSYGVVLNRELFHETPKPKDGLRALVEDIATCIRWTLEDQGIIKTRASIKIEHR